MKPSLFSVGYLSSLAEAIYSNKKPTAKLDTAQLMRISTIYGHLAKKYDLYELLFEKPKQLYEVDGIEIHTRDLALFTMMSHDYARGYYWKPLGRATSDPSTNNGVPLAFAGARRVFNKSYMSWLEGLERKDLIRCDMFLPYGLASLDWRTGEAHAEYGLLNYTRNKDKIIWDLDDIAELREQVNDTFRPKKVKSLENETLGNYYNKSTSSMRCLLTQYWCWREPSRCTDMITDFRDWDNYAKSIDLPSTEFIGLKSKSTDVLNDLFSFIKDDRKVYEQEQEKEQNILKPIDPEDDLTL